MNSLLVMGAATFGHTTNVQALLDAKADAAAKLKEAEKDNSRKSAEAASTPKNDHDPNIVCVSFKEVTLTLTLTLTL